MQQDPRFPIGKYQPMLFSTEQKNSWLEDLRHLPERLEQAVLNLDAQQLGTPYREGGWTVGQLVHHVADSHMNAYIRFKLAITEENPRIKPYEEKRWAELADVKSVPINISLTLLHALHIRWHASIQGLSDQEWQRTAHHPDQQKDITLWHFLGMYAWHGKHHVAHISSLRERNGW